MAVKKMRLSFDIDMPVFVQILSQYNSNMRIDMFADEKPARTPRLNGHTPQLLEGPKNRKGRNGSVSGNAAILAHLVAHKDRPIALRDLAPLMRSIGLN